MLFNLGQRHRRIVARLGKRTVNDPKAGINGAGPCRPGVALPRQGGLLQREDQGTGRPAAAAVEGPGRAPVHPPFERSRRPDDRQTGGAIHCVHNAGRSQMAVGHLTKVAHGAIEIRSSGSTQATRFTPSSVWVIAEGVDIVAALRT